MLVQLSSDGNAQFWFRALAESTYWNFVKLVHLQNVLLLFHTLLRILIHLWSCDLIKEEASAEKLVWGYKYPRFFWWNDFCQQFSGKFLSSTHFHCQLHCKSWWYGWTPGRSGHWSYQHLAHAAISPSLTQDGLCYCSYHCTPWVVLFCTWHSCKYSCLWQADVVWVRGQVLCLYTTAIEAIVLKAPSSLSWVTLPPSRHNYLCQKTRIFYHRNATIFVSTYIYRSNI